MKRYISNFWDSRFIFANAFIPLLVLSLYLLIFAYLLPDGVNQVFAAKSWKYILVFAGLAGLVSLMLFLRHKNKKSAIKKQIKNQAEKITVPDLILLLLPLMPVVQYVIANREILSALQMFYVLAIFMAFSLVFVVLVPKLLGGIASSRTLMVLGAAFAFSITNMASLTYQHAWFEQGSLRYQWLVLGGSFLICWLLYFINQRNLLYVLFIVLFFSNSVVQIFTPGENGTSEVDRISTRDPAKDNMLKQLIENKTPSSTPNIYLLVYDAYVPNETMLSHGIDNSAQEAFLTDAGFTLYPHTYSVAGSSVGTMSRVLNASTRYYSDSRSGVSGSGVVQNLLKSYGYRTYGIFPSDFFFRGIDSTYDVSFPPPSVSGLLLTEAILTGEFRFDVGFEKRPFESFLAAKREVLTLNSNAPIFLYTHSKFPGHSQNSGMCLPNEVDLYKERLQQANIEMRQDVQLLIENRPEAIIIILGDHGPSLTKNCTLTSHGADYDLSEITRQDIQDRFGTFLAIRWPTAGYEQYDDIVVLQDVFPAIFAYLFQDPSILDARIDPTTLEPERISGAAVVDGVIVGGVNDGEPLFVGDK